MKENNKIFITTTLPYVNSKPHIGHALEFIQADALKRYFVELTDNVVKLNIGLDEHGLKVFTKSKELEKSTQQYCDEQAEGWLSFCKLFRIDYDTFYRTTSPDHKEKVHKFWNECLERGDLYKKEYSGKYCVGCESFKTDSDLINGKCPDHNVEPIYTSEENWFFRTTKYTEHLLNWLDKEGKTFLVPNIKLNELRNVIVSGVDISVSRNKESVPWGISVPNDDSQMIYVWFEALSNYLFASNYNSEGKDNFWKGTTIQLCGPDNLRFQGHIFQALIASVGVKHTSKLLVHGTILDENGKKMSKSLGNVVDPIDQIEKYGLDAVRYYALAGLHTCLNGNWSERDLVDLYNSALADDYGNLLARTIHLIDLKACPIDNPYIDKNFQLDIENKIEEIKNEWQNLNISKAIELTNAILKFGNKYINNAKPWSENDYITPLNNLYYLLEECTNLLEPVIPDGSYHARKCLSSKKKSIIFTKLALKLQSAE